VGNVQTEFCYASLRNTCFVRREKIMQVVQCPLVPLMKHTWVGGEREAAAEAEEPSITRQFEALVTPGNTESARREASTSTARVHAKYRTLENCWKVALAIIVE